MCNERKSSSAFLRTFKTDLKHTDWAIFTTADREIAQRKTKQNLNNFTIARDLVRVPIDQKENNNDPELSVVTLSLFYITL